MTAKKTSPNVLCIEELYNILFGIYGGNIDTSIPLSFAYFMEQIAGDGDNITLINVKQENKLFSEGFSSNSSYKVQY